MFNNSKELKDWIIDYINTKGKGSLHVAIKNSKKIKEDILRYTDYLPIDSKFNQRCYHIINDTQKIPLCNKCKSNPVNFDKQNWGYLKYCSVKCSVNCEETKNKFKKTLIDKYGVDNISKSEYFKDLMINKNREKWGVDWYQQSEDFKEKSLKKCLDKYGFSSYSKTEEFKLKVKKNLQDRYGVDWYSKSIEFKEKFKKSCLDKWGVEHPMKNDIFKDRVFNSISSKYDCHFYFQTNDFKIKSTNKKIELYSDPNYRNTELYKKNNLEKYGVDHPMKLDEIKNKVSETCLNKYGVKSYLLTDDCKNKVLNSKYDNYNWSRYKDYILPSNKLVRIQGYENLALDILINQYEEDDIVISNKEIREEIGILNYIMDEKDRTYLPDIYIKSENKIIEVKSKWTYELELEKNNLKKKSCENIGIKFEFWIFNKKGELIIK